MIRKRLGTAALVVASGFLLNFGVAAAAAGEAVFEFGKDGPAITEWLVAQPFPDGKAVDDDPNKPSSPKYHEDLLAPIGGEAKARPKPGDRVGASTKSPSFVALETDTTGVLSLFKTLSKSTTEEIPETYIAYAYCTIRAEKASNAYLHVGFALSCRVWLNGKLLFEFDPLLNVQKSGEVYPVELKTGDNALLVKRFMTRTRGDLFVRVATAEQSRAILEKEARGVLDLAVADPPEGKPVKVRVDMDPWSDLFGDIPADVEAVDEKGKTVARETIPLGGERELALGKGAFRFVAWVKDFHGRELTGAKDCLIGVDPAAWIEGTVARARSLQRERDLGERRGLIELDAAKVEERLRDDSGPSALARKFAFDLALNLEKAISVPDDITRLRGEHEWAYISKVDGTGQPFAIGIPEKYDPTQSYPLEVYLHGAGGLHIFPGATLGAASEAFHARLLGRGRYGGYRGLSEIDILECIAYIKGRWNIAADKVHLYGTSMGGGGSFFLPTRHPGLFASTRPECGYGMGLPVENLLHVPVYSIHSDDDDVVAVASSRAPLARLMEFGGEVVKSETTGFGHGVANWKEGKAKAREWAMRQAAPKPESLRRVHYTATDELARGAYWVEVAEWGPEGRPATIDARLGEDNTLYVDMDNVSVARIDLAGSPARRDAALSMVVDSRPVKAIPAPLPEAIYIVDDMGAWKAASEAPALPAERLHYPGGAMALYHGEPLLVVWGTQGDEKTRQNILETARIARRSPIPDWPKPGNFRDGVPGGLMIYGQLPGKPDAEVTKEDMEKYNLLLIGTAEQNSVVAKLAAKLPIRIEGGRVVASDGPSWDFRGRGLGLLHYNPLAPRRLIYWAASDSADFYQAGSPLMELQGRALAPADFLLVPTDKVRLVASRRFDSRWRFEPGYKDSPRIPDAIRSPADYCERIAKAALRASGADFAVATENLKEPQPFVFPGETRVADLKALEYEDRLCVMDLTGKEILEQAATLKSKASQERGLARFFPAPKEETVKADRSYRVALADGWPYLTTIVPNPPTIRETEITPREMLERGFEAAILKGDP